MNSETTAREPWRAKRSPVRRTHESGSSEKRQKSPRALVPRRGELVQTSPRGGSRRRRDRTPSEEQPARADERAGAEEDGTAGSAALF